MFDTILTACLGILCIGLLFQDSFPDQLKTIYPYLLGIVGILTIISTVYKLFTNRKLKS